MLIIGGSGPRKTNALLNLIKEQNEPKCQFSIKKREHVRHLNDPKAFIEYSQYMEEIYNNINDYNPNKCV